MKVSEKLRQELGYHCVDCGGTFLTNQLRKVYVPTLSTPNPYATTAQLVCPICVSEPVDPYSLFMKGKPCPFAPIITCQEGYCIGCHIGQAHAKEELANK